MLSYEGCNYFRQRLVLSTLSGRAVKITKIREDDSNPGVRDYEANFLRLLDKITDGAHITLNNTGTQLKYIPGTLVGCKDRIVHECPPSRSLTYWLEALVLLLPFARNLTKLKLIGVTNDGKDISVDTFRTVTLPLLSKFFANNTNKKVAQNPNCTKPKVKGIRGHNDQHIKEGTASSSSSNNSTATFVEPEKKMAQFLNSNTTNFSASELLLKINKRSFGNSPSELGEVTFHCPTIVRVRPVIWINKFRCKRVRGVAFTSKGVSVQIVNRMIDNCRRVLNDFLPDVWIFTDLEKKKLEETPGGQNAKDNHNASKKGSFSKGFGLSLVAESTDNAFKSIDVYSDGSLSVDDQLIYDRLIKPMKEKKTENDESLYEEESSDQENEKHDKDSSDSEDKDSSKEPAKKKRKLNKTKKKRTTNTDHSEGDPASILGEVAAYKLLSEIQLQGSTDVQHQSILLHFACLAEEDEASRFKISKLSPASIAYLRHIKDFFGVKFRLREDKNQTVVASCVGIGLSNLNRRTF